MPGAVAPARLVCTKCAKNAHEQTTGTTETLRHSLRNGFTAYNALSLVSGLFSHHRLMDHHHET
jgi:hypothetical protein